MKNLKFFCTLTTLVLVSIFAEAADSYQHWVSWFKEDTNGKVYPVKHEVTPEEMADMYFNMSEGLLKPNEYKRLSTGIVYRIPQPDLYREYIEKCVRTSRPEATTKELVLEALRGSEQVRWGSDISIRVKNYYYSSKNNRIQFMDNFTGREDGIYVLLIDGTPTIKCDCGNPLEGIGVVTASATKKVDNTPPPPANTETKTETKDKWNDGPAKTEKINESVEDLGTHKTKTSFFKSDVGKTITGFAILSIAYAVLEPIIWPDEKPEEIVVDDGEPAGSPTFPAKPDGGPSGAGTYGFNRNHSNFSANMSQNLRSAHISNGGVNLLKNGNFNVGINSNMNNPVHKRSYTVGFSFKF